MIPCICCLSTSKPLLDLSKCVHTSLLTDIFVKHSLLVSNASLCVECHSLIRKADFFRKQVEHNCKLLSDIIQHQPELKEFVQTTNMFQLKVEILDNISIPDGSLLETIKNELDKVENDDMSYDYELDFTMEDIKQEQVEDKEGTKKDIEKKKLKKRVKNMTEEITSPEEIFTKKGSVRVRNKNVLNPNKIRTIVMAEEEMLMERQRERECETYLKLPYKCKTCIVGFDYEETLQDHMDRRHSMEKGTLVCQTCESVFDKQTSLKIHYNRHYVRFECVACGRRMVDKDAMVKHFMDTHDAGPAQYTCEYCGVVCKSKRAYRYHKEKHNERPQCAHCGKAFINKNSLRQHILNIHQRGRSFACEKCDKVYKGKSGLLMHRLTHAPSSAAAYCEPCAIQFKTVYNYRQHLRTHSRHTTAADKKFVCEECGVRFLLKRGLREHMEWQHVKSYRNTCHICNKKYSRQTGLEKHIKFVHEKKRPPRDKICDHCGRGFTTNTILAAHIRTHTGERPLQCAHCPANFAHSAALYTHNKLLHTAEKLAKDTC